MDDSIVARSIAFVLSNLIFFLTLLALICAAVGRRQPVADRFLSWLLLLPIGVGLLWTGFFHVALPDVAASFIGWKPSPFQFEVGMADLAFGVAGVLAFRASHGFKAATVLVVSIFLLGDAVGHVMQMLAKGNFAPGNAGLIFYLDILLPIVMIALLFASRPARARA